MYVLDHRRAGRPRKRTHRAVADFGRSSPCNCIGSDRFFLSESDRIESEPKVDRPVCSWRLQDLFIDSGTGTAPTALALNLHLGHAAYELCRLRFTANYATRFSHWTVGAVRCSARIAIKNLNPPKMGIIIGSGDCNEAPERLRNIWRS